MLQARWEANGGGVTLSVRKQRWSLSETHSFTPAMINELRLGYVRARFFNVPQGLGTNHTVLSGIGGFVEQSSDFPRPATFRRAACGRALLPAATWKTAPIPPTTLSR